MTINLNNLESYSPEELQDFKAKIHKEYVRQTKPRAYKAFEVMTVYLYEKGFKNIEGKDEKYFTNGKHGVFNCPHICQNFELWKNNPTMDRKEMIMGDIINIRPRNFFAQDLTQEEYEQFLEKAQNVVDTYSKKKKQKHENL